MDEGFNNLEFFPHSKNAIDTQRNYIELAGTNYLCQMTVMLVVIRVPLGLLCVFAGVCAGLAHAATLRGEKRRRGQGDAWMKAWCSNEWRVILSSLALLEQSCGLYVLH
jgi:hypothetical protein